MKLRGRVAWWWPGALIALAVLVLLTTAALLLADQALTRQANRRAEVTASLAARVVSEQTKRLIEAVNQASVSLSAVKVGPGDQLSVDGRRTIRRTLTALDAVSGVDFAFLVDPAARVLALSPSDPKVLGLRFTNRDWYRGVQRRSPYVSSAYRSAAFNRPRVSAVAARVGTQTRPIGYVVVTQGRALQVLVDQLSAKQRIDVTVTDQRHMIVASSGDRTQRLVRNPDTQASLTRSAPGSDELHAYAQVEGTGWVTTARVSRGEAYAGLASVRAVIIGLAVLGAATLALLLAALVSIRERRRRQDLHEQLAHSLLPRFPVDDERLRIRSLYRPGEQRVLLGGDFMDAIRLDDGTISVIVGDVCGHGPGAVGLANAVRHAWRTMKLAEIEGTKLARTLHRTVVEEVEDDCRFVTALMLRFPPDGSSVFIVSAGHPAPLLFVETGQVPIEVENGPAFGLPAASPTWSETRIELEGNWSLLAFTDGIFEGRAGQGQSERYGVDRLAQSVVLRRTADGDEPLLQAVLDEAELAHGGPLPDDVAMVLVTPSETPDRQPATVASSVNLREEARLSLD